MSSQLEWTQRCLIALQMKAGTNEKQDKEQKPKRNTSKESWLHLKTYYAQKLDNLINIVRKNITDM